MKKNIFGRKFKRDINARRALFRDLISSLILSERIETTEAKAKAIKGDVDKIITKVKKRGELSKKLIGDMVLPSAINKLMKDIAPRFTDRSGGYTRIIRMGKRFGDDASMVLMEWTEGKSAVSLPHAEGDARGAKGKSQEKTRSLSLSRQSSSKRSLSGKKSTSSSPSGGQRSSAKKDKKI